MGVGVSGWPLARAVARAGQLGVVSGVALDALLTRRLQRGDPGGHLRRALDRFPDRALAQQILDRFFVPGGIPEGQPFRPIQHIGVSPRRQAQQLAVVGNFVEVFLAKEGHHGPVGINYLEKIQLATPAALYGAMLAGVDAVLMGAGLPTEIPRLLDALARHAPATLPIAVDGAPAGERHTVHIEPAALLGAVPPPLHRPRLLAIVSSAALVGYLTRDPATRPDGFVLETPVAGGHSARPRGRLTLTGAGEPIYGPRDQIDVAKVRAAGLPFWLAGGYATPARLAEARAAGAAGVQVGTAFALCRQSGLDPRIRQRLLAAAAGGTLTVRNHPAASPTGFPFKVAHLPGTVSEQDVYAARPRRCDLGYLRGPYRKPDGKIGYRCPAEPIETFARKGGDPADAVTARCLCNGLTATIGLGQHRADGYREPPLVTLGQDLAFLPHVLRDGGYDAVDVIEYLLSAG
ncbi:nitronate monooxygenase [Phytohabitans sp. ZYX-F-186]|uniref:Nitronate monooxygenase n=1 Tax=Phytohabitans maris TaxID=3071409 RepID=A0ABU0ZMS6_9ACTN|nr:nitronate monooxygenase [Phytohabitans sp. ZYX-F-186]MDQ7908305.1 nitronate monooxygenase [Phytohabitans sp. ZYX-F-186]